MRSAAERIRRPAGRHAARGRSPAARLEPPMLPAQPPLSATAQATSTEGRAAGTHATDHARHRGILLWWSCRNVWWAGNAPARRRCPELVHPQAEPWKTRSPSLPRVAPPYCGAQVSDKRRVPEVGNDKNRVTLLAHIHLLSTCEVGRLQPHRVHAVECVRHWHALFPASIS